MSNHGKRTVTRLGHRALAVAVWAVALATPGWVHAANCSISSTPVAFGAYDVYSPAPTDSMGLIQWKCSALHAPAFVSLNRGGGNSFTPRAMSSGPNQLFYNLFLDAARTVIWGDGTGGTSTYTIMPEDRRDNAEVYGRIYELQDAAVGSYLDTITVVIVF